MTKFKILGSEKWCPNGCGRIWHYESRIFKCYKCKLEITSQNLKKHWNKQYDYSS